MTGREANDGSIEGGVDLSFFSIFSFYMCFMFFCRFSKIDFFSVLSKLLNCGNGAVVFIKNTESGFCMFKKHSLDELKESVASALRHTDLVSIARSETLNRAEELVFAGLVGKR